MMKSLYEILVPTMRNNGKPIRLRFHKVWDAKIRDITGGLTILHPTKGQWIATDGKLYSERMIPVRIACTKSDIEKIADFTASYYEQQAVFYCRVADDVNIINYDDKGKRI